MGIRIVNAMAFVGGVKRLSNDLAFVAAKSLTRTARKVAQNDLPRETRRIFDRPVRFTERGFYSIGAKKSSLRSYVGIKDKQADYLKYQVFGGLRSPKRKLLLLPADIKLDRFGNIPRGVLKQLITRAKSGRRMTRSVGITGRVSTKVDLFYGDPGDGRPVGVYKRVSSGSVNRLIPIVVMHQGSARYSKRFDFHKEVIRHAKKRIKTEFEHAWNETFGR